MIGRILCWLGVHRAHPACTYTQQVHWPDGSVGWQTREFYQCARCGHNWSKEVKQ